MTKYLKLNVNELDKLKFDLGKRKKYLKLLKEIKEDLKVFGNMNDIRKIFWNYDS